MQKLHKLNLTFKLNFDNTYHEVLIKYNHPKQKKKEKILFDEVRFTRDVSSCVYISERIAVKRVFLRSCRCLSD